MVVTMPTPVGKAPMMAKKVARSIRLFDSLPQQFVNGSTQDRNRVPQGSVTRATGRQRSPAGILSIWETGSGIDRGAPRGPSRWSETASSRASASSSSDCCSGCGAVCLFGVAGLAVLVGRLLLLGSGAMPFAARHVTDAIFYSSFFLVTSSAVAFLMHRSAEAVLRRGRAWRAEIAQRNAELE